MAASKIPTPDDLDKMKQADGVSEHMVDDVVKFVLEQVASLLEAHYSEDSWRLDIFSWGLPRGCTTCLMVDEDREALEKALKAEITKQGYEVHITHGMFKSKPTMVIYINRLD